MPGPATAKRGRIRSEQSRLAVLAATRELVTELGFSHVTIEKIAARARVGKPTIYRWWQSKNAILAECVLDGEMMPAGPPAAAPEEMHLSAVSWFTAVLAYVDENASLLRGLAAAAYEDPAIAEQLNSHLMKPVEMALARWVDESTADRSEPGRMAAADIAGLVFGAILIRLVPGESPSAGSAEAIFELLIERFGVTEDAVDSPVNRHGASLG